MTIQEEILKLEIEYNIELAELKKRCGDKFSISMDLEKAKKMLEQNLAEGYIKILKERLNIIREFKNRENFKDIEELEYAKDY